MWREGVIGVPVGDGKYTGIWYQAKVYDLPSEYGIEGGRISKLQLRSGSRHDGEIVASYDRGWNIKPKTEAAEIALSILLKSFK